LFSSSPTAAYSEISRTSRCDLFLSLKRTHSKKRITNRISTTLRIQV
ncbi:hypothetical protein LINPERHAP1_LOCUS18118, partial [Linum perenne]